MSHNTSILHKNLFLACFQVFFWLVFRPSMWRAYISNIEPGLSPDFAWFSLPIKRWHFGLFLVQAVWILLIVAFVGLCLFLFGFENQVIRGILYAGVLSFTVALIGSSFVSVAFGLMASVIAGVLVGFAFIFNTQEPIWQVAVLLSSFFAASFASSVLMSINVESIRSSLFKQFGSIIIGVFLSGLIIAASIMLLSFLLKIDDTKIMGLALGIGLAYGLVSRFWLGALAVSLGFWGIMSFLIKLSPEANSYGSAITGGLSNALLFSLLFALPYLWARRIGDNWAGVLAGLAGSVGVYLVFFFFPQKDGQILLYSLVAVGLGLSQAWWRSVLFYPFEAALTVFLSRQEDSHKWLRWQPAFWDEHQRLPLYGLEKHLIKTKINSDTLAYLKESHQAWAIQAAQFELYFKQLELCNGVDTIKIACDYLPTGQFEDSITNALSRLSEISRIVKTGLEIENDYQRLLTVEQAIEALGELLRNFSLSHDLDMLRLWRIAENWRQSISDYSRELNELIENKKEIENPYITGRALTRETMAIFVGRREISRRIDLMLRNPHSPPILLYGQRRIGKTSLLNLFSKLLSDRYLPLFVDLQGPVSLTTEYSGFLYNLSRAMIKSASETRQISLPALSREALKDDPFSQFDEWLDDVEASIEDRTVLLTFDEFEALDHVFQIGRLDKHLILGMFRHIIQHRPRFKIVITGAYRLEKFPDWANYLNNAETITLSYLKENEARELINNTIKSIKYTENAIQHILELTHSHPALVQWFCKEIVVLKNEQPYEKRNVIDKEDVIAAIQPVLEHARSQFSSIFTSHCSPQESKILQLLAEQREGVDKKNPEIEKALANLVDSELIESTPTGYRFQVEMFRRWVVNKG